MAKFDKSATAVKESRSIKTTDKRAVTGNGALGYARDTKSELFMLAVSNMVGENTFYEGSGARDNRFRDLVHSATQEDPEWVRRFIPYLRTEMYMRSASIVMAAEYVKAGGPNGRDAVNSACSRPDEPAEFLAYWTSQYGKKIPAAVKRGLSDACQRLYHEKAALKYDGQSRNWRMADVIELVHAKPKSEWQSRLYRFLIEKRHNRDKLSLEGLEIIEAALEVEKAPVDSRRDVMRKLGPDFLGSIGFTWEKLSGWIPGGMDKEAWEAIIPSMGYMALLRNLRNFDNAGVSDKVAADICSRLSDPEEVGRSRQFPLRFLSAWKNAPSMRWASALEKAVELSVGNIPEVKGNTLILIDHSGSTNSSLSERSSVTYCDALAVFGIALALRCDNADVYQYDNDHDRIDVAPSASILRTAEKIRPRGGTSTWQTVTATLKPQHDRVVILTDEQCDPWRINDVRSYGGWYHDYLTTDIDAALKGKKVYTFNVGGYKAAHGKQGQDERYAFGGLTDAGFKMMALIEAGKTQTWPF